MAASEHMRQMNATHNTRMRYAANYQITTENYILYKDMLTFSFTLAAFFPLLSFLDFLLAGPFAAFSVNSRNNTLINQRR